MIVKMQFANSKKVLKLLFVFILRFCCDKLTRVILKFRLSSNIVHGEMTP